MAGRLAKGGDNGKADDACLWNNAVPVRPSVRAVLRRRPRGFALEHRVFGGSVLRLRRQLRNEEVFGYECCPRSHRTERKFPHITRQVKPAAVDSVRG